MKKKKELKEFWTKTKQGPTRVKPNQLLTWNPPYTHQRGKVKTESPNPINR